jgi:hypothetical protein
MNGWQDSVATRYWSVIVGKELHGNPPAVHGNKRCRMHGGAPGSGAPRGYQNALKHGLHRKAAIEERRQLRAFLRKSQKLLPDIERRED